jgi:hypothetical protein
MKTVSQLGLYILNTRGTPVRENNLVRWAKWFDCSENRVLKFDAPQRGVRVSTVFLGINHNGSMRGRPLLWETMIFGGKHDGYCKRYASRADALAGHAIAVEMATLKSKRRSQHRQAVRRTSRGDLTVAEFVSRGQAAQQAVDAILSAGRSKRKS